MPGETAICSFCNHSYFKNDFRMLFVVIEGDFLPLPRVLSHTKATAIQKIKISQNRPKKATELITLLFLFVGNTQYLAEGFEDTRQDPSLIAIAFYNGLWAYDGWYSIF